MLSEEPRFARLRSYHLPAVEGALRVPIFLYHEVDIMSISDESYFRIVTPFLRLANGTIGKHSLSILWTKLSTLSGHQPTRPTLDSRLRNLLPPHGSLHPLRGRRSAGLGGSRRLRGYRCHSRSRRKQRIERAGTCADFFQLRVTQPAVVVELDCPVNVAGFY